MDLWLRIPYVVNILILAPVCLAMFTNRGPEVVFQEAVARSAGLERLVGSLWLAILLASIAGLAFPRLLAPLLGIQIVYKSAWLATYVFPRIGQRHAIPLGVATTFLLIVLAWPIFLWLAYH